MQFLIYGFILFVFVSIVSWIVFLILVLKNTNPYIKAHRLKNKNDKDYNEYIKWVHKNKMSTPYSKLETIEEQIENHKIKNLFG